MCSALLTEGDRLNAGQLLESVERKLVARKLGNVSQFAVLKSFATLLHYKTYLFIMNVQKIKTFGVIFYHPSINI